MEAEVACLERRERLEVEEEDLAIEETQGLVRSRIEWPRHPLLLDSRIAHVLCIVRKTFEHVIFECRNPQTTCYIGIVCTSAS